MTKTPYWFFQNHNNIVGTSTQFVLLLSSMPTNAYVKISNFNARETFALYTARRLSTDSFISHEDVYLTPSPKYIGRDEIKK